MGFGDRFASLVAWGQRGMRQGVGVRFRGFQERGGVPQGLRRQEFHVGEVVGRQSQGVQGQGSPAGQGFQQLFEVQAQAGPAPFVVHFVQATVAELSQAQHAFEVSERRLGDARAAVEGLFSGVRGHSGGRALTDFFVFVAAQRADSTAGFPTFFHRSVLCVRQAQRDQRAALARCANVAFQEDAVPSFAAVVRQHAALRADVVIPFGDVYKV